MGWKHITKKERDYIEGIIMSMSSLDEHEGYENTLQSAQNNLRK